jgi:alpha-tubulin suppressor-like RCC1 family protein
MSLTKITTNVIADNAITQNKISNTVTLGGPKIANVQYADASFTVLDDTAANTSGTARLIINGEGFNSGAIVIVGTTQATSTTRVSATQLRANVTAQVAGSYPIYVQNTDGGTAIRVGGVTFSNTPIWGTAATLTNQAANTAFAVSISATSDSSVTYSNTTALPAGTSLLSNGYFYGTVTIGAETTYTFDVKANDAENQDVSRTFSLTVTVTPEYQLWAWGRQSDYGDLGLNSRINTSSPTQVGSLANWNYILASDNKSLAIKSNGTLWAVGGNGVGQLGLGDTIHRSSPVQVGSSTNWSKIGGRYSSDTLAIKTDGTLWAWGQNFYGTLGLGDRDSKSSPTQVGSSTDWSYVEADNTSFAIKTNGTLWSWGYNGLGNLGQSLPTSTHRSSPTQVGSNTNWSMISVAFSGAKAIKTDGTLWTWGDNSYGTNGTNDNELKSSPTQIGSGTNWSVVSTGDEVGAAIKTDGTLWMWGRNESGQLGLNQQHSYLQNKSSPVQVGSSTNWQLISAGKKFTLGIKTDGTLWGWGKNGTFNPHLGLNETTYKSSPTQIGSSTGWKLISAGSYHALAAKQT